MGVDVVSPFGLQLLRSTAVTELILMVDYFLNRSEAFRYDSVLFLY